MPVGVSVDICPSLCGLIVNTGSQHLHINASKVLVKFPSPVFSNNNAFFYIHFVMSQRAHASTWYPSKASDNT